MFFSKSVTKLCLHINGHYTDISTSGNCVGERIQGVEVFVKVIGRFCLLIFCVLGFCGVEPKLRGQID